MEIPAISGFVEVSKLLKWSIFWLLEETYLFFILKAEVLSGLSSKSLINLSWVSKSEKAIWD